MQLDDVIATTSPDIERITEAMHRSVRWLDRCIAAHKHPEKQNLFCIIQGGLDLDLRRQCCEEMVKRDTPGIALGGLSGGEAKDDYCRVYVPWDRELPANPALESILAQVSCRITSRDTSWELYVCQILRWEI